MTHFSPDPLSAGADGHLSELQHVVRTELTRETQYNKVKELWARRKHTISDRQIWQEIEQKLSDRHPLPGICQYCEFDRTAATEHFFSKKHFPEKAFDWNNYLLICYRCNSAYKGDRFAVFDPYGSNTSYHLPNTRGSYASPPNDDAVLINPRTDNPQDYLMIDLDTGMFLPRPGVNARGKEKAEYTYCLLHLNDDANLLRYRKKAIGAYYQKLKTYASVKHARNFEDLINSLTPPQQAIVLQNHDFAQEQARLLEALKKDLQEDLFPCVWQEIKQQINLNREIADLFALAPEAETW